MRTDEPSATVTIRDAVPDDAPGMARVIVDTWFAAHRGQVSEAAFEERRATWGYEESERGWRRSLTEPPDTGRTLVAVEAGRVVAVAASQRLDASRADIGALYVETSHQGRGIGQRLTAQLMSHYDRVGCSVVEIRVLATNRPARAFYERIGGVVTGSCADPEGEETIYAWFLPSHPARAD